jgi:iron complex outermembrane recepter protein
MSPPSLSRASACLLAVMTVPALAENTADVGADLSEILVVGQRDAPIEIEPRGLAVSLGEDQFAAVNAFNVEDLMKYAPNFFVRKRYAGDSNGVPGFRGTHSTQSARSLVMVDGFVVSNFLGSSFGFAPKWGAVGPGEVKQFDIVYGPYSSRYAGNSMGGIINISTRDPQGTEAFVTTQGFAQPYKQYNTDESYTGYSAEAGIGWKQKNGPFSARLTSRYFRNKGQPMSWYFLTPATGTAPGTTVAGAVVDPDVLARVPGTGSPAPIFAAQSPADITQSQTKLKLGYNDGRFKAQALFIYWYNLDSQTAPETYLRDASGMPVYEGRVTTFGQNWTASGANFSRTSRKEYLAGLKLENPIGPFDARLNVSTYNIASSLGLTSNGYVAGKDRGAGTLTRQGQTGWYTGDLQLEHKGDDIEIAFGGTANLYETNQSRFNTINWRTGEGPVFTNQTFGKTRMLGLWGEGRFKLADAITITAGVRYDSWKAFDGGIGRVGTSSQQVFNRYANRTDDAVSLSVSVEAKLGPNTSAQLSLATSTRFPTVGELFQGSLNGDGSFNPNSFDPGLRPEKSRDANLIVAHDFGPLKLTGSLFYQRVRDTIFSLTGLNQNGVITSSFKNIDLTRQYGVELIAETKNWPIDGMSIEANAALNNAKTIRNAALPVSEGVFFPRIPRWRLNGNIRYDVTEVVQLTLGARYASRPNTNLEGTQRGDTFGYTSELFALDARVNWKLPGGFRLSAGVDNLTDNREWVFHPYPQRTFLVEAGWTL